MLVLILANLDFRGSLVKLGKKCFLNQGPVYGSVYAVTSDALLRVEK